MTITSARNLHPGALALLLATSLAACGGATPPADAPVDGQAEGPSGAPPAGDPASGPDATGSEATGSEAGPPAGGDAEPGPSGTEAPAGEPAPKASAMDLGGTLSPAQVAKFVEDHQSYFDPCIQIAEKGGKVYKVSITTRVYVGPRGKVNKTEIVKTTSKDDAFGKCVTGAFEKIAFGKPREGATATLVFPMTFSGAIEE